MQYLSPKLILIAITTLVLLAGTVWIHDTVAARRRMEISEDFQTLVGGLGFGPALDLSNGSSVFDPRLGNDADQAMPGVSENGSDNPFSIFRYPRLKRSSGSDGGEN